MSPALAGGFLTSGPSGKSMPRIILRREVLNVVTGGAGMVLWVSI